MIYQLKVSLQHMSPPIWRRVLVDPDLTLLELHHTIQRLFEWEDYHLHDFLAIRINGENVRQSGLRIGIGDDENGIFGGYAYDETVEKLTNWLVKEKDKLFYMYDFGDDWGHEIVLEKILDHDSKLTYPTCVKVKGAAPEEDSRFEWIDEEKQVEEIDVKTLQEIINERLQRLTK